MRKMLRRSLLLASLVLFTAPGLRAQTSLNDRVLVVYNAAVHESKQVADYYMAKRSIPASHLCKIDVTSTEQVNKDEFDTSVKRPIQKCLNRLGKDTILYTVFSYQTPWHVDLGPQTNALDQFVADIWDEYLPERSASQSDVQPYYGAAQSEGDYYQRYVSLAEYRRQPNAKTIYSVWRLDAPSATLAEGLVDKALETENKGLSGIGCFDRNRGDLALVPDFSYGAADWDIHRAADFARQEGFTVIEDGRGEEFGTAPAPLRCDHAALYAGWYALNHYNDAFTWNPGAIGIHLDSASALCPRYGTNWSANALAHGITVTAGATTEPYLENLPHPDQAFLYLFEGANVGDAFLRSERLLKWNIINIGDPLYRPFLHSPALSARLRAPIIFALASQLMLGDANSGAAVAIDKVASQSLDFTITADHPELVTFPSHITLPAGHDAFKFPISTHHVSSDPMPVRFHVKTNGYEASNTLVLFSLFQSVAVSPATVKQGSPATLTLLLRRPAFTNTEIALKSGNPAILELPAELTIPAGQQKAVLQIPTRPVTGATSVEISANYEGLVRSATLKLSP